MIKLNPMYIKIKVLFLISVLFLFAACEKDNGISSEVIEINKFIDEAMSTYYFWNVQMPNLSPSKEPDSKKYFEKLLYDKIDQWSFITDDVDALNNYFAGIRKEMGYSLRGYYAFEGSNQVVAFIEYVEPGGPADNAGLKRGDMIVEANGETLTPANYGVLFNSESLTLGLGTFLNGRIEHLSPYVKLQAEVLQVDPILKKEIFENNGSKVGYLCYTSFINELEDDLIAAFGEFKAAGISELILDLRYNGGGAVSTAKLMAGMIGPSSLPGELFIRTSYNTLLTNSIREYESNSDDYFYDYFESYSNNLNLSRVYVLTTQNTASASEMVMYSLMPYMQVIQIGEQTHGKYYGSTTISDEDNHSWALQPIIMRAENKDNSIDYSVGLVPDVNEWDEYSNELGTMEDVLTAMALDLIWGTNIAQQSLKSAKIKPSVPAEELKNAGNPLKYEMIVDLK
ncbi:peptidase S41 [Labilibacter sediminis]|nr:peptidase S41 [Labilibacter sediminis]